MQNEQKNKAVVLAQEGLNTNLLIQEIEKYWEITDVVIESGRSPFQMLKKRAAKIGWIKAIGQVAFIIFVTPFLRSKKRIYQIVQNHGYSPKAHKQLKHHYVDNISYDQTIDVIEASKPAVVFVNGTSIISAPVLEKIKVPVVNIHVGITPKYRGVHGGYWALYNQEPDLFGVTLHYIDAGIDTGKIIDQAVIKPALNDNYKTYPALQYVHGLKLLRVNRDLLEQGKTSRPPELTKESQLHYHPGFFQYLIKRISKGVK